MYVCMYVHTELACCMHTYKLPQFYCVSNLPGALSTPQTIRKPSVENDKKKQS